MVFARSIATVFESVADIPIAREQEIASLLISYEDQQQSGKDPDRALLERAAELLEQRFKVHQMDDELVRLAQIVYCGLGKHQVEIAVLRQFLATSPESDPRAWAWWHLVDSLALDGCAGEAVNEQRSFLAWALSVFPAETCFFVIADGTQARSWMFVGAGYEWLHQFHVLFQRAPWTCSNRLDRFYCLRTAVRLALDLHAENEARHAISFLRDLLSEDRAWQEGWWISVETNLLEMVFAQTQRDIAQVRARAEDIMRQLAAWEQEHLQLGHGTPDAIQ
jgi:hypothetical protein